jgi:preprotein translocase subunit SecA
MNVQRQVVYAQRRRVLDGEDLSDEVRIWIDEVVENVVAAHTESEYSEEWDLDALVRAMVALYGSEITADELREEVELDREALVREFQEDARDEYTAKEEELGAELMREVERFLILQIVDRRWREHLENMDYLRDGIHLRAMAQKDPLTEYRAEGHAMFQELNAGIREEVILNLFHAQIEAADADELERMQRAQETNGSLSYEHESVAGADAIAAAGGAAAATAAGGSSVATPVGSGGAAVATQQRIASEHEKIGRNDPCWCGSGKKFKKCHGQ